MVYAETFEQFIIEGAHPLMFLWNHNNIVLRDLAFTSDRTHKFTSDVGKYGLGFGQYGTSKKTLKLGPRDPDGNVLWKKDHWFTEFSFPISTTHETKNEPTSKGPGGGNFRATRYLSLHPSMEEKIIQLNQKAAERIAHYLSEQGKGIDDLDRWYSAERIIANN